VASVLRAQLGLPLELPPRSLPVLEEKSRGARFRELSARRVLNSPATTGLGFWSLNPYVGCEFGCSYCYARKTHEWVMERAAGRQAGKTAEESGYTVRFPAVMPSDRLAASTWEAFEHEILVKNTAPDILLRTLNPEKLRDAELVIGTATDPYQPAEREFRLTRRVLEVLLRFEGLSIGLITKSPLVTRDLDLFQALGRRHTLSVNLSLASMDAGLVRRLEVRSPAPQARIRALARLAAAGIHAGLLIAPILPGITDGWGHLAALFEAAQRAGARYVHGMPLRLGPAARAGFLPVLEREFPGLVERYRHRYGSRVRAGQDYERALQRRIASLRAAFPVTGDRDAFARGASP
jgi:DNA repair photolyase